MRAFRWIPGLAVLALSALPLFGQQTPADPILKAMQQVPITLLLDNLHWADAPSLSLLEFVTQELTRSRLLVVGTYRDSDISKTPLLSTLGDLSRASEVQRVHLTGLSRTAIGEVAERMCGVALSEAVIGTI